MKVIIVGAGVAGLTLAYACQRAGMEVKLYDKAKELRNIGGGILLWPHGIRYLKWLGLDECLQAFWVPVEGCNIAGHAGEEIFAEDYAAFHELIGGRILPIDRSLLQQTLLAQLAANVLELNKNCVQVKTYADHARVFFADGTEETADIIVGADGIHSAVRKNINTAAEQEYTNYCWWGGIIEQKYLPNLAPDRVFVAMGVSKICMIWPTYGDRFMWYLPVKMPLEDFQSSNTLEQLHSLCKDWNVNIQNLITAPAVAKSFQLPIYALPPQPHWTANRTVLLGDAAHALGPILGQGASQAIEDVFALFNCLQRTDTKDIPSMLTHYETLRREKYIRLAQLENQTAAAMISEDLESLKAFEAQAPQLDLATMYKELIPLVDANSCLQLAAGLSIETESLVA